MVRLTKLRYPKFRVWWRHRNFRISREGRYWLLLTGLLWGAGWYKSINLVILLGALMLAVWLLNAFLVRRGLRKLELRRWLDGPVFARKPVLVELEVANPERKTRFGVRLDDRGSKHERCWFVPRLAGRTAHRFQHEVTVGQRGWYSWKPPRVQSGHPFGLAEASKALPGPGAMLVFPELGQLHRGRLRHFLLHSVSSMGRLRQRPRRQPTAQCEFHGLRAFRSGDSPRWIHWRTTAHRGELMVREFEDIPTENLVVIVDPWLPIASGGARGERQGTRHSDSSPLAPRPSSLPGTHLEDALSLAATICWEWCRQKGDRLVLAVAGPCAPVVVEGTTGSGLALLTLECLALVAGHTAIATDALLDRLAGMELPSGPIVVVSTRATSLADTLTASLHRPVANVDISDGAHADFFEKAAARAT
jgi:uncharacterized protein (DUF58 family)